MADFWVTGFWNSSFWVDNFWVETINFEGWRANVSMREEPIDVGFNDPVVVGFNNDQDIEVGIN